MIKYLNDSKIHLAGYETISGGYRAVLEERFSNVVVEVGQAREKNKKDQSKGRCSCVLFVPQRILAYIFTRQYIHTNFRIVILLFYVSTFFLRK